MSNAYAEKRYEFKNVTTINQWLDIFKGFEQKADRLNKENNCELWNDLSVDIEQYHRAILELREGFKRTYGKSILSAVNEAYCRCFTVIESVYEEQGVLTVSCFCPEVSDRELEPRDLSFISIKCELDDILKGHFKVHRDTEGYYDLVPMDVGETVIKDL